MLWLLCGLSVLQASRLELRLARKESLLLAKQLEEGNRTAQGLQKKFATVISDLEGVSGGPGGCGAIRERHVISRLCRGNADFDNGLDRASETAIGGSQG